MGRILLIIGALFFGMTADKAGATDPENQIFLDLKDGRVVIDLLPNVAPNHVEQLQNSLRQEQRDHKLPPQVDRLPNQQQLQLIHLLVKKQPHL